MTMKIAAVGYAVYLMCVSCSCVCVCVCVCVRVCVHLCVFVCACQYLADNKNF